MVSCGASGVPCGGARRIICVVGRARREKFADQDGRGILSGFFGKALREREDVAFGEIKFETLDAVHGEKNHARSEGLAVADLGDEIVERG